MLVPKLRFKREDGSDYPEWRNKSFANAFAPLNNNTFSRDMLSENGTVLNIHYGDILVKFGEVCDIQAMDIPKVNAEIDTSKYDELKDGDIILADTAEDETVGKAIEIYHTGTSKVVSGLHTMACRPNDKYAPKYMGYYINSPTYHNQLLPFMQGIKVTSIGRKNIADTVIYYPADLEEQQKIADFLSTVDEVIAQSKAEVQNLEQQKKAAMQKIFSQEVRFKREDGTDYPVWKNTSLGKIGDVAMCKRILKEQTSENGDVPFFKISTFGGTPDAYISYQLFDDFKQIYRFPQKGAILISAAGTIGKTVRYNGEDAYYQDSNIVWLEHDDSVVDDFLYQFYQQVSWEGLEGSTIKRLYNKNLLETPISLPCLEEQQKIADFLSAYDEAIRCAKQELDKWKELKKGLLQQMFV